MKDWQKSIVYQHDSIRSAIKIIDSSSLQIALVVDSSDRLIGVITDGDIRRCFLKEISLDESVEKIMFKNFTYATDRNSEEEILNLMKRKDIGHIPIIDSDSRIVGLKRLIEFFEVPRIDNPVVIMAGGLGTRLRPLTTDCPKPMLKVGEKPILETIIENFKTQGFWKFYITVNYKSHLVEEYFGDGKKYNVKIEYIREKKRLGTAGALSLLGSLPEMPLIVMNGDVLTKINFKQLLKFHGQSKSLATMCVREFDYKIPYGVVQLDGDQHLKSIREKPIQSFLVNAGIYVLTPDILKTIPEDTYFDITSLFEKMLKDNMKTSVFPIREYWIDIGRMNDFEKANSEFNNQFKGD